jgi:PPOX class probable F420-dependent enzyme
MTSLPGSARALLESPALAHLVTLNPDGSPQVSIVWVGLDGDEIVAGHLPEHRKVRNIRNDSRVALSIETGTRSAMGLNEYLVIHGTARRQDVDREHPAMGPRLVILTWCVLACWGRLRPGPETAGWSRSANQRSVPC